MSECPPSKHTRRQRHKDVKGSKPMPTMLALESGHRVTTPINSYLIPFLLWVTRVSFCELEGPGSNLFSGLPGRKITELSEARLFLGKGSECICIGGEHACLLGTQHSTPGFLGTLSLREQPSLTLLESQLIH